MTIGDLIDLIEIKLLRAGIKDTPRNLIRDVIRIKFRELASGVKDISYELTTDGSREYELPEGMKRVEFVTVDDYEAIQCTPEEGDRTNAENSAV